MNTPPPLAELLKSARHSVEEANAVMDPRFHVGRVTWAINEIQDKIISTSAIDAQFARVHSATNALLAKANTVGALTGSLVLEKAALHDEINGLEASLQGVLPNQVTHIVGGGW